MLDEETINEIEMYNAELAQLREKQHRLTESYNWILEAYVHIPDEELNLETLLLLDDLLGDSFLGFETRRRIRLYNSNAENNKEK